MSEIAQGMFEVEMTPGAPEASGEVDRFDFTKAFTGDLAATGVGVMLSCGDPQSGAAGYVAIETVRGRLGDLQGGFALQQLGQMHNGSQTLTYQIVPGSGLGALKDIVGALELTIDEDGTTTTTSWTTTCEQSERVTIRIAGVGRRARKRPYPPMTKVVP